MDTEAICPVCNTDCLISHMGGNHYVPKPCPSCKLKDAEIARMKEAVNLSPESLARCFHHHYERLAPLYNWTTRENTRTDWDSLPSENKGLMTETAKEVLAEIRKRAGAG